jgi:photosystem II stability/assembly factor-like uncharacterized protein
MSDLDARLRGLRDELNGAIPLPDVERVTGRARARRRTQLGAIMAVIVVALTVPVLRALPFDEEAANPPAQNTSYLVDFADHDHGYALARTCVVGTEGCRYTLYRTKNGGDTWQPNKLPSPPDGETTYFGASLYVLGPDEVTIQRPRGNESDRITSTDGGRSWQTTQAMATVNADTAPLTRGSLLIGACGEIPHNGQGCDVIGSLDPSSGDFRALPQQPPLTNVKIGSAATESGRWWVTGQSRVTPLRTAVSVSEDGGRTWLTTDLDPGAGTTTTVVEHDGVLYAVGGDSYDEQEMDRGVGVWRSDDGGQSWERMGISSALIGPVLGTPVVAGDGTITVSDGLAKYVSTDLGRTFYWEGDAAGGVKWTRAGYLRMNADKFALSTDGVRWREFTVG